jgi:hypothetical protein
VPDPARSPLLLVADLTIEVGDERGTTTTRLTSEADGLVLDVPDPSAALRGVPPRGRRRDLVGSPSLARLAGIPVRVTSRGRDLGRVHVTTSGRVRLRPTLAGAPTLVRTAVAYGSGLLRPWFRVRRAGRRST